jgi:uncharacterized membrane protein YfcA
MPDITPFLIVAVLAAGIVAGGAGALLGIGGGVFLVPLLNVGFGVPIGAAAAVSLVAVIATSSAVSAGAVGKGLINLRLGMTLEVATAGGSLLGGVTAHLLSQSTVQALFAAVASLSAVVTLSRLNRRNVLDASADPGTLGGCYYEDESGAVVTYRVKRLPLAIAASFVAGNVSSLLGIGGGVIKVPVLNAWCGVPLRPAAATSVFMIGVTAAAGAVIYYGHGQLVPELAAAAVLGVQLGSWGGMRLGRRASARDLKVLLAVVLFAVAALMTVRAVGSR